MDNLEAQLSSFNVENSFETLTSCGSPDENVMKPIVCSTVDDEARDLTEQESAIQSALIQQTNSLYEQYAREQHPKDPIKQKELICEMQKQYFSHYMTQVYQFQLIHQQQQLEQLYNLRVNAALADSETNQNGSKLQKEEPEIPHPLPLIPATIWTRGEIAEFKREIWNTQRECCIKISSLATATIRVPTHPDGAAICWEFATDHYDLGFGLYFEWDLEPPENISVNISESSDEECEDDEDDLVPAPSATGTTSVGTDVTDEEAAEDVECGRKSSLPRRPTDELIPIYRRDCHTEVYCGSHQYPGIGVYVFKFDNSFSLWRSKWLYYRIYYTH